MNQLRDKKNSQFCFAEKEGFRVQKSITDCAYPISLDRC